MHNMILIFILFQILAFQWVDKWVCVWVSVRKRKTPELWKTFVCRNIIIFILRCYRRKMPDRRAYEWTNERWKIDFLESTIRESGVQEGFEFKIHFNPFPVSVPLFCAATTVFISAQRKLFPFSLHIAMNGGAVEGWKHGDHSQCNALSDRRFWVFLTPQINNVCHSFINSFSLFLSPSLVPLL